MKQLISILGSTGSIGLTTLKILDKKKRLLTPYIFLANKNYKRICHQIKIYKPRFFLINDEIVYKKIKKKFHNSKTIIVNSLDKIKIKKNQILQFQRFQV